jgi:hypothetical protein
MLDVYANQQKPWVQRLLVPYVAFFGVSSIASVIAIGVKVQLLVRKIAKRAMPAAAIPAVRTLGKVSVPPVHASHPGVVALHEKYEVMKTASTKFLAMIPLVVFEGAQTCGAPVACLSHAPHMRNAMSCRLPQCAWPVSILCFFD